MNVETYMEMVKALSLSPEERLMVIEKRKKQCICKTCPNYKECSAEEDELAFCTLGKSECIADERGCICPTCPLAKELNLKNQFYCVRGSENQQVLVNVLQVRGEWVK